MIKPQPYKLKNNVQHYEWGTKGNHAFIPKLLNIEPKKDKPYAELWMGAHPKSPSRIVVDGKENRLDDVIREYPNDMLGAKVSHKFSKTLPFLLKVLSAGEALSIQAHPNKKQAKALHKKNPAKYPDKNQKHEIAIALDSLTALVGFKPFRQLEKTLLEYPEFVEFVGKNYWVNAKKKKSIKGFCTNLIKKYISHAQEFDATVHNLHRHIQKKKNRTEIENHFIKLHKKYKSDVGLLILFFLNLIHLKRGEAIFTKPGIPHAYLKGNILECMSNSDNVIRAGLTSKYKDLSALVNILTFELDSPNILKGKKLRTNETYKTEATEFVIHLFRPGTSSLVFKDQSGPRILLLLKGKIKLSHKGDGMITSRRFSKGDSIFLPSILSYFTVSSERDSEFVLVSVPKIKTNSKLKIKKPIVQLSALNPK